MADASTMSAEQIEDRVQELLEQDTFDPPRQFVDQANLTDPAVYDRADSDPAGWWEEQAQRVEWYADYDTVLDDSDKPEYKWFVGGSLNASYNCLDRHVEAGNGDRTCLHWRGEEGERRDFTYEQMLDHVKRFANALKDQGVGKGDVVGIYLPMIPEAPIAMLACARIGAIHNVVFAGFSPEAVRERMETSQARALITADENRRKGDTLPMKAELEKHMDSMDSVETVIVVRNTDADPPMTEGRDVFYDEIVQAADAECEPEQMSAEDPMFILYSSGSTGAPKGILHTTGGYMVHVTATSHYVLDLKPESDVFWCTADVGWITGHSYIVYGPMSNGVTNVVYEGAPDYPAKDIIWEIVEDYGVTIFYTAPTAIRTFMKWGPEHVQEHDVSSLRLLGTVGEPINPRAWLWYHVVIGNEQCPIVDTWWQTETGGMMISPLPGITTTKPGSATRPLPGVSAKVLDDDGHEIEANKQGKLALDRPWPGMLRTLYKAPDRYVEEYWEKFGSDTYEVGDAAYFDDDGYMWVVGRTDDVVNVAGHRLSTAEIESAIVNHSGVAEAAAVGRSDEDKGQAVAAFVILEDDTEASDDLEAEIREEVSNRIGKIARPEEVLFTASLPKTRSGKIMRRLLRDIAEGDELGDTTTLEDPEVVEKLEDKYQEQS